MRKILHEDEVAARWKWLMQVYPSYTHAMAAMDWERTTKKIKAKYEILLHVADAGSVFRFSSNIYFKYSS